MDQQEVLLTGTLTKRGLRIPTAQFQTKLGGRRQYSRFLRALTVIEKPQGGRSKFMARKRRTAYKNVRENRVSMIYLPRTKALGLAGILDEVVVVPELAEKYEAVRSLPDEACIPSMPLYDYQQAAVDYLCEEGGPLGAETGTAYVQMGTGIGKSRFAMAVAARIGGPAFVVVPTKMIRTQWLEEFAEVFPELTCASYANPPKNSRKIAPTAQTHDFVIGIVNTVRAKKPGFFEGYATVIFDEAHELCSKSNIEVLWIAQGAKKVLGLSATPDKRPDTLDRVVYHFLGAPIWAEKDIPNYDVSAVNFRGRVREVEYRGDPEHCETVLSEAGTVSAIGTIGNFIRDPARLNLVAAEVERLYNLHETESQETLRELGLGPRTHEDSTEDFPEGEVRTHGIFVFAEHRDYLPQLRETLLQRFDAADIDVPEIDAEVPIVLRGGATRDDVERAQGARIVLTTYGYSRRGVSLVDMTSIVLATPRRNGMDQILGRCTRRGSDESIIRQIVDIKDVRTALKGQSTTRRKVYKEKEYPIYRVKSDFESFTHIDDEDFPEAALTSAEKLYWAPEVQDENREAENNQDVQYLFDMV